MSGLSSKSSTKEGAAAAGAGVVAGAGFFCAAGFAALSAVAATGAWGSVCAVASVGLVGLSVAGLDGSVTEGVATSMVGAADAVVAVAASAGGVAVAGAPVAAEAGGVLAAVVLVFCVSSLSSAKLRCNSLRRLLWSLACFCAANFSSEAAALCTELLDKVSLSGVPAAGLASSTWAWTWPPELRSAAWTEA